MKNRQREKGVVLLMVIGFSLVTFVGLMGLLFVLRANIRNLEAFSQRARAYYLCETGASVGILDIAKGNIGAPPKWKSRTFPYTMGSRTYTVKYDIDKPDNVWMILATVGPPDFDRTYHLRVGGRRAFPIFSRGFPGK